MIAAPEFPGGRDSEASSTAAGESAVKWIEPVFGTDISAREEQRQTGEVSDEGRTLVATPQGASGAATAAQVAPQAATLSAAARSARRRRSPASQGFPPVAPGRSARWRGRRSGRLSSASATMAPTPAPPTTRVTGRAIAITHIERLNEAISVEGEAAASALHALHGTLAAEVLAALHQTLAAERELAIARIVRLGAERAAISAEIDSAAGSAVARTTRLQGTFDATSIWTAISPLLRLYDGSRRPIRDGTGPALILVPGNPNYFPSAGTELSARHGPAAGSRRRLVVNAFALLVATVGVVTYYGNDIWSPSARQTRPNAAGSVVHAAAPSAALASNPMPSDPVKRIAYFRHRAAAGDTAAQYALGILYAQGDGVAQNYASAASWFRKAASGGIVNAQDLAALYERGFVTPQDYLGAAYWYRNAAERGVEPAMPMLAFLYERGQGVKVSPTNAYAWYRAAARRGDTVAGKRAAALFAKFDGAEKGRAVVRAAEIVAALHEPRDAPSGSAALIPGDWIGRTIDRDHTNTN